MHRDRDTTITQLQNGSTVQVADGHEFVARPALCESALWHPVPAPALHSPLHEILAIDLLPRVVQTRSSNARCFRFYYQFVPPISWKSNKFDEVYDFHTRGRNIVQMLSLSF